MTRSFKNYPGVEGNAKRVGSICRSITPWNEKTSTNSRPFLRQSFTYTTENNIGGYGQGNNEKPQGRNDQLGALKNIHKKTTIGCKLHHPNGEDASTRHGGGFINDQIDTILLPSNVTQETIPVVEDVLQRWQNLLNVSGGDLS